MNATNIPFFFANGDRLVFVGKEENERTDWTKFRTHTQVIDRHVLKLLDLRQLMLDMQDECEKAIVQLKMARRIDFPTFNPKGGISVTEPGMSAVKVPGGVDLDGNRRYLAADYVYPDANYVRIPATPF